MVHQWVTQGTKGSIDNTRRPGRGSMMRPTINEESDCLRKKNLQRRHCYFNKQIYCTVLQQLPSTSHIKTDGAVGEKRGAVPTIFPELGAASN